MKYYQNYHKHTSLSHRYNKDSSLVPMDYINVMKPLAEQGIPQIYSTVEHAWQSNYFHIYNDLEAFNNKNKDNPNYKPIKFIFGTEAYWVEDRLSKDGSNNHIVLLAKNDNGRKKLNRAIYESFKTGYYYKGRMDLDILLNLPKDDIFCTSACIAFWLKYAENGWDKIDDIVLKLNNHFTDFYLEVQANNTDKQKKVNEHILDLHYKYNIPIIGATDSHEISLDQMDDRDYLLKSNHITYEDEDGNYMDFPSYDTLVERFKNQNILNDAEITECLENTNKILDFEDIVLDRSLKVPVAKQYRGLTQEERNNVLKTIITKEWQLQKGDINKNKLAEYKKQNRHDLNEILTCNMADYFIDSYLIMKRGQELGGILTDSGRGSSVSFYLNKLLRLTKVDKVNAPVTMYSERFLTATRILESKVPPDVDNNVNAREPFIEAQKEIVGEEGTFDLLALGTLKYKSAFKMYARAHDLDVETQNIISKQIDQYETALKYAKEEFDDDEIDISIYDYVDEKYRELIDGCQQYRGIVDTLKSHPCGTLCYSGNAIEDVGVIMVKSESTGRECFVALQESATIDSFGFLKQDYLVVDTVSLISDIYKEIGMKSFTINELLKEIDGDKLTWDIYSQGKTMCINQVEQEKSTQKVMRYKPQNISELCSFIAGIRPSFKSMYNIFESRRHFDYGIKAFDNLLQDEYRSSSFIFYQEDLMKVLGFAGFPMKDTYTIIKAISKKKKHVIEDAKVKFIPNFTQAILDTKETDNKQVAEQMANKVWTIIENSASYGFNCVAGDTIIVRGATNKHKPLTVEEMWLTLNDKQWAIKHGHKSLHEKYNRCGYGTALSMGNDNRIYENHIIDITRQPKAQLYIITTESGKQIKTTINHKFPTINGIKTVDKLQVGDSLYIMGEYEKCTNRYVFTDGNFEKNLPKKGQQGFQHKENGDSVVYDNFRNIKLTEQCVCEDCGQASTRYEVHHIDFDRTHNSFDNYAWLCPSCHKKRHYANGRVKRYEKGIPTYTEKIVSIELGAIEYVYDVSMSDKINHNYVANDGIVTCNCSHSFCMAIDSVTLAWQKAHYPLEFYKVALQRYTDKGEKNKVIRIKKEMQKSGITLNDIAFGQDNRKFSIDKTTNSINQTMASIKDTQKTAPQELYELQKHHYDNFLELLRAIDNTSINSKTLTILICLNYFSEFGNPNQLLEIVKLYNKFGSVKVLTKSKLTPQELEIASKYAHKATEKQLREIDTNGLLNELIGAIKASTDPLQQICYDVTYLGYTNRTYNAPYYAVTALETNNYGTTYISLYNIQDGSNESYKLSRKWDIECEQGDILEVSFEDKHKHTKDDNGNWVKTDVIEKRIKLFNVILKNPKTK